jgi:hypothetical protein
MRTGDTEISGGQAVRTNVRKDVPGTIYLLHFEKPYHHARHYLGWTEANSLDDRLHHHRNGNKEGSKLMAAVSKAGIGFTIARLWAGTRHDERKLKNQKNASKQLCPICIKERRMR